MQTNYYPLFFDLNHQARQRWLRVATKSCNCSSSEKSSHSSSIPIGLGNGFTSQECQFPIARRARNSFTCSSRTKRLCSNQRNLPKHRRRSRIRSRRIHHPRNPRSLCRRLRLLLMETLMNGKKVGSVSFI